MIGTGIELAARLERLQTVAPRQVAAYAQESLRICALPFVERRRLAKLAASIATVCREGFPFPAAATEGSEISGGVVYACVRSTAKATADCLPAREALAESRDLLDHLVLGSEAQALVVAPTIPRGDDGLDVRGRSCGLALAAAWLANARGWRPTGFVALSGEVRWRDGRLVVEGVDMCRRKLEVLEHELPGCVFVYCSNDDDSLQSATVSSMRVPRGAALDEVLKMALDRDAELRRQLEIRGHFVQDSANLAFEGAAPQLDAILATPIENNRIPSASFEVRLVIEVQFDLAWTERLVAEGGWQIAEKKDFGSWLAKLDQGVLARWSAQTVCYASGLPLVLLYDLNELANARVEADDRTIGDVRLAAIDLVPSPSTPAGGPGTALLGLVFRGSRCDLKTLLSFTSARSGFRYMRLAAPRLTGREDGCTIGGLVHELRTALCEQRRVRVRAPEAKLGSARSFDLKKIFQIAHLSESTWPINGPSDPARLAGVWELFATVAQPKEDDHRDTATLATLPRQKSSPRTLYGLHDKVVSALTAATANGFNQESKPRVFMESQYLHWVLATRQYLATEARLADHLLQATFAEELHRRFFRHCEDYLARKHIPSR